MRFFVNVFRRLVRTSDDPLFSPPAGWTEVSSAEYDEFMAQSRNQYTAKQLKQLHAEGDTVSQVAITGQGQAWFLESAILPLPDLGPFKSQREARKYAKDNSMMVVSR